MVVQVGDIYWSLYIDAVTGKTEWERYYVRTIRNGQAAATLMAPWIVKERTKMGKVVELIWQRNIPAWCRKYWRVTEKPITIFTTKLEALYYEKRTHKPNYYESKEIADKALATINRMIKAEKRKIKEKKNGLTVGSGRKGSSFNGQ